MITSIPSISRPPITASAKASMRVIAGLFGLAIAIGGLIASWSSWWHKP